MAGQAEGYLKGDNSGKKPPPEPRVKKKGMPGMPLCFFFETDRSQQPRGLQPPPEKRLLISEKLIGPTIFSCFSPQ